MTASLSLGALALTALAAAQLLALVILVARLSRGRGRRGPIDPVSTDVADTTVSVLVPTLDEGARIAPCLEGLHRQGMPLVEVLVIDSGSTDSTREQVRAMAARDPRFRVVDDGPLPPGWVGKVWALESGRRVARGEWLLGIDADVEPRPGMVAAVVEAARACGFDLVSFSPRFAGMTGGEQWVQAALLATLVYRLGAAGGADTPANRLMANGQCYLGKADALAAGGGYEAARASFSDDVTLSRHYAARGWRVGFLDGSRLYVVRSYTSLRHMWREWGRSIDLRDSTPPARQLADLVFLALAQAAPLLVLASAATGAAGTLGLAAAPLAAVVSVSVLLLVVRVLLLPALAGSYERPGLGFWLSPLADPLAVLRVALSTVRRPTRWRGRAYGTR